MLRPHMSIRSGSYARPLARNSALKHLVFGLKIRSSGTPLLDQILDSASRKLHPQFHSQPFAQFPAFGANAFLCPGSRVLAKERLIQSLSYKAYPGSLSMAGEGGHLILHFLACIM